MKLFSLVKEKILYFKIISFSNRFSFNCLYPAELKKLNAISFLCPNLFLQLLLLEFLALKLIEQIWEGWLFFNVGHLKRLTDKPNLETSYV